MTHTDLDPLEGDRAEEYQDISDPEARLGADLDLDATPDYPVDQDDDLPAPRDPHAEPGCSLALWTGDEGSLREEQRRALVTLWKHRFLTSKSHPTHYAAIVASPRAINSRLNDHFAVLMLDRERGVAWKTQAPFERSGGQPFPTMMTSTAWSLEESLLLVRARIRYRDEQVAGGDVVFIDRTDMHDYVRSSWANGLGDKVQPASRIDRAIETLVTAGVLLSTQDPDRFRVEPVIEALMPHEVLLTLLRWADPDTPEGQTPETQGDPGADPDDLTDLADDPADPIDPEDPADLDYTSDQEQA